jgi:hypothetical protein
VNHVGQILGGTVAGMRSLAHTLNDISSVNVSRRGGSRGSFAPAPRSVPSVAGASCYFVALRL